MCISEEDEAGARADKIVELFLSKENDQKALRSQISGTSKEKHLSRLIARGSSYMSAVLAPGLDIEDRVSAVHAGIQFLEHGRLGSRARVTASSRQCSQNNRSALSITLNVEGQHFASTMSSLLDESYPVEVLTEVANVSRKLRILSLFVRSLQILTKRRKQIVLDSADEEFKSGDEFVENLIYGMASDEESFTEADNGIFIANAAKEAVSSPEAVGKIASKLIEMLGLVRLETMPSFVYQVLLMVSAKASQKIKQNVLAELVAQIAVLEKAATATVHDVGELDFDSVSQRDVITSQALDIGQLREAQGALLSHLAYLVRQDNSIGEEYIKLVRQSSSPLSKSVLTTFGTGFALMLATISSLREKVFEALLTCIDQYGKQLSTRSRSKFISEWEDLKTNPLASLRQAGGFGTHPRGWDVVGLPVMNICLRLPGKIGQPSGSSFAFVAHEAESIALLILPKLYKVHAFLREEMLSEIVSRITSKQEELPVMILHALCRRSLYAVLPQINQLKRLLESLPQLSPLQVIGLVDALAPVLSARQDFRDSAILVARKGLVLREPTRRAAGAAAIVRMASSCALEEFEVEELLRLVHRALGQQAVVRLTCYYTVDLVNERTFRSYIMPIVETHFKRYVDPIEPPYVRLSKCFNAETAEYLEPLPQLMSCFARSAGVEHLRIVIDQITTGNLIREYELDAEDLDLNSQTPEAAFNRGMVRCLLGSVESLIGIVLPDMIRGSEMTAEVLQLLAAHRNLRTLCRGSSISTKHETPQQGNDAELDRNSTRDAKIANRKRTETRTEPTTLELAGWTVDGPFIALEECIEALKWLQGHREKSILESRQHLRELLMSNLSKHKYSFKLNSESTKQSLTSLLGCFISELSAGRRETGSFQHSGELGAVVQIIESLGKDQFDDACIAFRKLACDATTREEDIPTAFSGKDALHVILKACDALILDLAWKHVEELVTSGISFIRYAERCSLGLGLREDLGKWASRILRNTDVEMSRELTGLLVVAAVEACPAKGVDIAVELHKYFGDIADENDMDSGSDKSKGIWKGGIASSTASVAMRSIYEALGQTYDEIEWGITALQSNPHRKAELDGAVCSRANEVIDVLGPMLRCRVRQWSCGEAILRSTMRLYRVLTSWCRAELSSVLTAAEQVTKLAESSSLLTPKVYSFLTYLTTFQCSGNAKSRTLRESKLVPNLIFNIEQYERSLIRLNKKFQLNCLTSMRRSTARDFKILEEYLVADGQAQTDRQLEVIRRIHSGDDDEVVMSEPGNGKRKRKYFQTV
ncbi:hypothetical protein NDN08_006029 [Rhodosorus marinus]|uniref:Sister chromatid cohesion protein n=1 Tax=Rhodosorus marinus TaxID=101924 RepID=A0AAV8UL35_9RHOD|nr:hypothetical protein NDN08_006029 [Rhodosorus marinus]